MEKCPCGSKKSYAECCEPLIKNDQPATSPEAMMRSRYTAYTLTEMDHLLRSTHPDQREGYDEKSARDWSERAEWQGLEIVETKDGMEPDEGTVEFIARYRDKGIDKEHHEVALFKQLDGEWYFYDCRIVPPETYVRSEPKIGRNDPCPCGSEKKYKKCCG